jgi:Bacterial Ig-like domain (group 2)
LIAWWKFSKAIRSFWFPIFDLQFPEIKTPTLSLQRTERRVWGIRDILQEKFMNCPMSRFGLMLATVVCLIGLTSCGHDQQLVSITVQPNKEIFGAANIPVSADAGLTVQLRAIGNYIHPPVSKDVTNQVVWSSNTPDMVTVDAATGLITATGQACGDTLISATVTTNHSIGNVGSSGAIVTGTMTATVVCFTGP